MQVDQARCLKDLETENKRLKRAVADLTLDKQILQEVAWGFYWGWWISWSLFVGIFVARISRGRTVREFVYFVLVVPKLFNFL